MNNWDEVKIITWNCGVEEEEWGDCSICGEPFTEEEWDERHTDSAGGDCHEGCCDVCAAEDVDGMDLEDAFDLLMGE